MTLVSVLASCATIGLILSQLTVIRELRRASGDIPILQSLASFLSSILWLKYGLLKHDDTISMVNGFGASVALYILFCFWHYSAKQRQHRVELAVLATVVVSVVLVGYVDYASDLRSVELFSLVCCAMTLVFLGSPLGLIGEVVSKQDASVLLPSVATLAFANNVLWAAYGHIHQDPFMFFPNSVGAVLCSVQLALIAYYGRAAAKLPLGPVPAEMAAVL
ncbi:Sugar transporter [Coemansia sp. RSA 552]|nr:Sugar transporter [Coemansia sp. RSA 552]